MHLSRVVMSATWSFLGCWRERRCSWGGSNLNLFIRYISNKIITHDLCGNSSPSSGLRCQPVTDTFICASALGSGLSKMGSFCSRYRMFRFKRITLQSYCSYALAKLCNSVGLCSPKAFPGRKYFVSFFCKFFMCVNISNTRSYDLRALGVRSKK